MESPERFHLCNTTPTLSSQSLQQLRYASHLQQSDASLPRNFQAIFNSYNAPQEYPQSQHSRTSEDGRMTASQLETKQAQRPEDPEPSKKLRLRRMFGSSRRKERREKDEEARQNNYYY